MAKPLEAQEVAGKLAEFSQRKHTIIFAGAGVGNRLSLPTWYDLLDGISKILETRGLVEEAALLKKRLNAGSYLSAAAIVRTCDELIASERFSMFSEPFVDAKVSGSELEKLEALVHYPSAGIVTTNYDRSILRACAKYRPDPPPIPIELNDESMRGAATRSEFILARIHGRVEIASTIQISDDDYKTLRENRVYLDFVAKLLEFRSVLFVGFSFADPAIVQILKVFRDAFGPNFPSKHAALIPEGAPSSLSELLTSVNIQPWVYDAANHHHALWNGFRMHYESKNRSAPELGLPSVDQTLEEMPETELHRFLAFAYAQSKQTASSARSLSDLVRESVVISAITEDSQQIVQRVTVVEKIRTRLKLSEAEASAVVDASVGSLVEASEIVITSNGSIQAIGKKNDDAGQLLSDISISIAAKCRVVYDVEVGEKDLSVMPKAIEEILLARAWDIGAYYSGASVKPNDSTILAVCERLISLHYPGKDEKWKIKLCSAIRDFFSNPPKSEAYKLAQLGRAAFAVQLALSSPRSTMFQSSVLPDILYFDSNIILPAIVEGHPLQRGYLSAVIRLIEANNRLGHATARRVGFYFLNEIISHRRRAIELVGELGLEDNKRLEMYVGYNGASHVNVFISGYSASKLIRKDESFAQFLARCAPYSTENSLEIFLAEKFKIHTIRSNYRELKLHDYNVVYNELRLGYELASKDGKSAVLVEHEAEQLVGLLLDLRKGHRPIFVTADAMLRRIVASSNRISHISGSIVSEVGFVGLVDLLVGLKPDPEVYTRLLWGMQRRSAEQQIRDYLISRSISAYNEALLVQMPELLEGVVDQHQDMLKKLGSAGGKSLEDSKEGLKLVDRIESEYLRAFDLRIQELRKQFGSGSID